MAPFVIRLILLEPDHPACDELIHAVAVALRRPIPQVETGLLDDPGDEKVEFYVGTEYEDPVALAESALETERDDWRDYIIEIRTPG